MDGPSCEASKRDGFLGVLLVVRNNFNATVTYKRVNEESADFYLLQCSSPIQIAEMKLRDMLGEPCYRGFYNEEWVVLQEFR